MKRVVALHLLAVTLLGSWAGFMLVYFSTFIPVLASAVVWPIGLGLHAFARYRNKTKAASPDAHPEDDDGRRMRAIASFLAGLLRAFWGLCATALGLALLVGVTGIAASFIIYWGERHPIAPEAYIDARFDYSDSGLLMIALELNTVDDLQQVAGKEARVEAAELANVRRVNKLIREFVVRRYAHFRKIRREPDGLLFGTHHGRPVVVNDDCSHACSLSSSRLTFAYRLQESEHCEAEHRLIGSRCVPRIILDHQHAFDYARPWRFAPETADAD